MIKPINKISLSYICYLIIYHRKFQISWVAFYTIFLKITMKYFGIVYLYSNICLL